MPLGSSYAGIPPGPLSAYLGIRAANEQRGFQDVQQAGTLSGLLENLQITQREAQMRSEIDALGPNADLSKIAMIGLKYHPDKFGPALIAAAAKSSFHGPAIGQLQQLREMYVKQGAPASFIAQVDKAIEASTQTEKSQGQEDRNFLLDVKQRTTAGQQISKPDLDKATIIYRQLTTPKVDLATGSVYQPELGLEFDPSRNFGIGQPAPVIAPSRPAGAPPVRDIGGGRGTITPGEAKPGEAELKILSESDALRQHLKDLDKSFKDEYVGPAAGRVGGLRQSMGGLLVPELSQNEADFRAQAALYKNRLIKFVTGAQMGEAETKRLINEIPDANDPPTTFKAKRDISEKNIEYVTKAYQRNMERAGIRIIGGTNSTAPSGPRLPTSSQQVIEDGKRYGWTEQQITDTLNRVFGPRR